MKIQNNSLQAKRILSAILAVVFVLSVLSFGSVTVNAATNYDWETWGNSQVSKFSVSPKTGTFTIENTDYTDASFARRVDIESAGTYQVSVEVKLEDFQTNPSNPQEWTKLMIGDRKDGAFYSRTSTGENLSNNKWETISCSFITTNNDSVYIQLCLGVGKGKATFRNLKIEKVSNEIIIQNSMIQRKYDVSKDSEWVQTARNINIKDFNLPDAIGKTTLTYESALALVGKTPEEIAKSVKTVGDVLQYMIASRFGYDSPGIDDYNDVSALHTQNGTWGFDYPGNKQLIAGYACCCGGMANTVSYLLQDDYDREGQIQWTGESEGHVVNWVKIEGKYYVFDFVAIVGGTTGGGYNQGSNYPVIVLDKLENFYDKFPSEWYEKNWGTKKSAFTYVFAFESKGVGYPRYWGEELSRFYSLPIFAEGKIITVYKRNSVNDITYKEIILPLSYNYWGIPMTNFYPNPTALTLPINILLGEITFSQNANVTNLDQPKPSEQTLTPQTATTTASKVLVNGKEVAFDAYNINGNNYFKLRDLAYILNGTQKQFEVGWDGANNAISLTKGKPYTLTGGEMAISTTKENKTANPTSSKIYLDSKEVSFTAYNIDGNNYFKLRDIMKTFDVYVGWDGSTNTITLDTSKGYVD